MLEMVFGILPFRHFFSLFNGLSTAVMAKKAPLPAIHEM